MWLDEEGDEEARLALFLPLDTFSGPWPLSVQAIAVDVDRLTGNPWALLAW